MRTPKKNVQEKAPPHAIEIEDQVIGSLIYDNQYLAIAMTLINSEKIFYSEVNQILFLAIKSLFNDSRPVDMLTVMNEVIAKGKLEIVGGATQIAKLTDLHNPSDNVEFHIAILKQKWVRRVIIENALKNIQFAENEIHDEFELLEKSTYELMQLQEEIQIKKSESGKEIYRKALEEIAQAMQNPGATGLISAIDELDKVTGGWQSPDLIIVAGRPGMGKTAFALSATKSLFLDQGKKVLIFSLEMTSTQIVHRLIAGMSNISGAKIKKGYISEAELITIQNATKKLYTDNLIIDDTTSISIGQLRAKAMVEKMKNKDLALIVVDYLQLMTTSERAGNREREISIISAGLKNLAKELKIPVIALCQLSRAVEGRANKKPQLSDLRESGSIEQDADLVVFINRPHYYGITEYENGDKTEGTAELVIAKNRHGGTQDVLVAYNPARFEFCSFNAPVFNKESVINTIQSNFDSF